MTQMETVRRPAPEGDTALPKELVDWLQEQGYRASWQPYNENLLNQLYGRGFEPLPVDRIKENEPDLYKRVFEGEPGTRRLFIASDTGYIRNFDAVLMIQRHELWESMEAEVKERIEKLQGPTGESTEELATALAEMLNTPGVSNMSPKQARSPWVLFEEMQGSS
jgi:hypothetical protein